MQRQNRHSIELRRRFSLLLWIVVSLLSGCSKMEPDHQPMPYFGPRLPHVSPFSSRKVVLADDSFTAGSTLPDNKPQTVKSLPVVSLISNKCMASKCAAEADPLSCWFHSHAERRQDMDEQYYSFKMPRRMTYEEIEAWVGDNECVIGFANEYEYVSSAFNDTHFERQLAYLDTIKFQQAQQYFPANKLAPVKVAVIDTGVGVHSDLGTEQVIPGVIWREDLRSGASRGSGECLGIPYTNENPYNSHGTMVGGIIATAQNNSKGIAGIAPNAQIISFTVGDCTGKMKTSEIGNAMIRAINHGAEIVNMSFGGSRADDIGIRHAIINLLNTKAMLVASAGNDYLDLRVDWYFPAYYSPQYPGFLAVAWGMQDGELYHGNRVSMGSNYSPEHVKILAPGTNIYTTITGDAYASCSGSSCSAPIVSGAAALTVGFMKFHNLSYDEALLEYLLTKRGVTTRTSLVDYVKDGAVLDLEKLGQTLRYLLTSGTTPRPITASDKQIYWDSNRKEPYIQFNAIWNLEMTHFGARLGLFDSLCGYSEPCKLQDFELPGHSGSLAFRVSRNETLPVLPQLSDPNLEINLTVAVYYKIWDEESKKWKNNYGVDAMQRINLRDFDMSTLSSPFTGEITNIRTDMQYLYVQGWSCLQGSNEAARAELIKPDGTAIQTDFAYYMPWIHSHAGIKDTIDSYGFIGGPFVAPDIQMMQRARTWYLSGLEASPLIMKDCRTLTSAHGFEFGVPLSSITSQNLTGTQFSVRVTNPRNPNDVKILADSRNANRFTFPAVNYQPTIGSNITLTRGGDSVSVGGNICSASPSPVHVEVSYSQWNLRCRLKQTTAPLGNFPDFADSCYLSLKNSPVLPLVYTPKYSSDRDIFAAHYHNVLNQTNTEYTIDLEMTAAERDRHVGLYPVYWPNASIGVPFEPTLWSTQFINWVVGQEFYEVPTQARLTGIALGNYTYQTEGPRPKPRIQSHIDDRSGVSIGVDQLDSFWDKYDEGEEYTPAIVAYTVNKGKPIGEYIFRTYRVAKLMREAKKFETPLSAYSYVFGHTFIGSGTPGGTGCPFRFSVSHQINDLSQHVPTVWGEVVSFLKNNENPGTNPDIANVLEAMRTVPIDIRFFQDSVMILHLLSNYGTGVVPVPTLGRGQ